MFTLAICSGFDDIENSFSICSGFDDIESQFNLQEKFLMDHWCRGLLITRNKPSQTQQFCSDSSATGLRFFIHNDLWYQLINSSVENTIGKLMSIAGSIELNGYAVLIFSMPQAPLNLPCCRTDFIFLSNPETILAQMSSEEHTVLRKQGMISEYWNQGNTSKWMQLKELESLSLIIFVGDKYLPAARTYHPQVAWCPWAISFTLPQSVVYKYAVCTFNLLIKLFIFNTANLISVKNTKTYLVHMHMEWKRNNCYALLFWRALIRKCGTNGTIPKQRQTVIMLLIA